MNISPDGVSVRFKTEPEELFEAEKSGAKPNTARIVDQDEYLRLVKANPKKIFIQHQQEIFLRTITNVHATEGVFGKVIVVVSWRNEDHHHAATRETVPHGPGDHTQSLVGPHSVPVEPGPHNASADCVPDVPSMPSICLGNNEKCTGCLGRTLKEGDYELETALPTELNELAPVLLPRTLIEALGRHRRGKSHADFVKELLIAHLDEVAEAPYRDKRAEEREPMHD